MILKPPFIIGARLLPALKIGGSYLSMEVGDNGIVFYLDTPDQDHEITGFRPGAWFSVQDCFESILGFMEAAAEAQSAVDRGRSSDNADIFDPAVMRWCQENADEIGCLRLEIEEIEGLIV